MKDIVLFQNEKKCCGCAACQNICPQDAIEMRLDEKGFLYPICDEKKCVGCRLCEKVCVYNLKN